MLYFTPFRQEAFATIAFLSAINLATRPYSRLPAMLIIALFHALDLYFISLRRALTKLCDIFIRASIIARSIFDTFSARRLTPPGWA